MNFPVLGSLINKDAALDPKYINLIRGEGKEVDDKPEWNYDLDATTAATLKRTLFMLLQTILTTGTRSFTYSELRIFAVKIQKRRRIAK